MAELTPMVLLVTGSRTWDDVWALKQHLDDAALAADIWGRAQGEPVQLIIRHGACYPALRGGRREHVSADWLAHLWIGRFAAERVLPPEAQGQPGLSVITEQERPADWEAPCTERCNVGWEGHRRIRNGRSTCAAAGMYRNEAMIAEEPRPDRGLAFLRGKSAGTTGCIKSMKKAGVPYTVVPYDPVPHGGRAHPTVGP